jgi:hypothetical protein
MTAPLCIAIVLIACGFYAVGRWSRRNPNDPWVFALWYLGFGPRTDVAHMTRRELFESAGSFVSWTLLSVIVLQLVLLSSPSDTTPWLQGIVFGLGVFLLMGAAGATYMLVRGLLRRRAYLSRERFSSELHLMPFWVLQRDWNGLDGHFRRFAARTCGVRVADAIAAVDLNEYCYGLAESLQRAVGAAAAQPTPVIAFLHRPHEDWAGAFCVYGRAMSAGGADPRRLGACVAEIPGPPCVPLARIYLAHGDVLNVVALYLIARTVATLGRCLDQQSLGDISVCVAVEGDTGLLWLREQSHALDRVSAVAS